MSPRRWATQTRYWAYNYLVLRDGDQCALCGAPPTTLNGLDIDHVDGDHHNNAQSNLRLLCRACNTADGNRSRPAAPSVLREREIDPSSTRTKKLAVDPINNNGTAESQASFLYELDFRTYILGLIADHGWLTKRDAINAGAEKTGCNPLTAARYLDKLTSLCGPLQESRDMLGATVIIPRVQAPGHAAAPSPVAKPARRRPGRLSAKSQAAPTAQQQVEPTP